jgi:hypothetical protein
MVEEPAGFASLARLLSVVQLPGCTTWPPGKQASRGFLRACFVPGVIPDAGTWHLNDWQRGSMGSWNDRTDLYFSIDSRLWPKVTLRSFHQIRASSL